MAYKLLLGVGLTASTVIALAVLFWLPLMAMVALFSAAVLYACYFAAGRRRSRLFRNANIVLQLSLIFAGVSETGHVILALLRS